MAFQKEEEEKELAEKALQIMLAAWLKTKLNELGRDLGPMIHKAGLGSGEARRFLFGQLEQAVVLLKEEKD